MVLPKSQLLSARKLSTAKIVSSIMHLYKHYQCLFKTLMTSMYLDPNDGTEKMVWERWKLREDHPSTWPTLVESLPLDLLLGKAQWTQTNSAIKNHEGCLSNELKVSWGSTIQQRNLTCSSSQKVSSQSSQRMNYIACCQGMPRKQSSKTSAQYIYTSYLKKSTRIIGVCQLSKNNYTKYEVE
jgi:hypothetical protein